MFIRHDSHQLTRLRTTCYCVFVCVSSRNDDLTEGSAILFLDRRRRRAGGILCERPLVRCTNGSIISSSGLHEYNIKNPKNVFSSPPPLYILYSNHYACSLFHLHFKKIIHFNIAGQLSPLVAPRVVSLFG